MLNFLRPNPTLTEEDARKSLRQLSWVGVTAGAMFTLGSGGFMAAFALALGANNFQVGILAALPFASQVMRLPSILLLERFRARKALGVPAFVATQLSWLPIGLIPFFLETPGSLAVFLVIVFLGVRGVFAPLWVTTSTSWLRDLIPAGRLGSFFGSRQAMVTAATAIVGLGGSFFVQWWQGAAPPGDEILAFSILLIGGVSLFGTIGSFLAARAVEPRMPAAAESERSPVSMLLAPLKDRNYSHLIKFPVPLEPDVKSGNSLLCHLYAEGHRPVHSPGYRFHRPRPAGQRGIRPRLGPLADRAGSKTVLSLSSSLYLLVIIGWVFVLNPDRYALTIPLLAALHLLGGVAAAGVTLTATTLALKVAPSGQTIPYSGVAGIATSLGSGIGPLLGGLMADFFFVRSLSFTITWASPGRVLDLPAMSLAGYDFLFVTAFLFGLLSMNLLVALREEGEIPRDVALSELIAGMGPVTRAVSSVPGLSVRVRLFLRVSKAHPRRGRSHRRNRLPVGGFHPGGPGFRRPGTRRGV